MKKTQLHYFVYLAKSGGLLILASLFREFAYLIEPYLPEIFQQKHNVTILTTVMYVLMLFAWGRKTFIRVVSRRIRAHFVVCTVLMMSWFIFRLVKYTTDDLLLARYMWYNYYLAMIGLPLFSLHIALLLRNPDNMRNFKRYHLLDFVAAFLYILVLTNPLHNFVFIHYGKEQSNDVYDYNWGCFLIMAWIVIISVLVVVLVIRESRITLRGFYFMYPVGLLLMGALYTVIYVMVQKNGGGRLFIDFTPLFCWIFCAIWEFLITAGLVPTNRYYVEFFNVSSLSAYITDGEGNVLYESQNAIPLEKESFEYLIDVGKTTNADGREAYLYSIGREYVVYENDTSEIMDMIEELEDARENLMGEKFILQKANEAEAARVRIEEKEYLFEKLTGATISQLRLIRENMKKIETADADTEKRLWEEIVIWGTFVKRYSNLLLLKEGGPEISALELYLSLQQSMENLKLMGVNTGMMVNKEVILDIENVLQCYELFENVVEWDLAGLKSIHVIFSVRDKQCSFLVEAECDKGYEEFDFFEYNGNLDIDAEGNTVSATLVWENKLQQV